MADANIKLANGTDITISGTAEEIAKIMVLYNQEQTTLAPRPVNNSIRSTSKPSAKKQLPSSDDGINLASIINTIKDCEEAEIIETKILDIANTMNRALMCLYINARYFASSPAMTTGDISQILKQLGVPVATANISNTIMRKAKSYIMYDGVRTKGAKIRYSLNRRGIQYFEDLLEGIIKPVKKPASTAKQKRSSSHIKVKSSTPHQAAAPKPRKASGYKPKYNSGLDLLGLKDFVQKLTLKNNSEYLIAFHKFLTDEANLTVIDGDDIFTCFSEMKAEIRMPGSFMNTLRNAQNRDHLISYDSGFSNLRMHPKGDNMYHHDIVKR